MSEKTAFESENELQKLVWDAVQDGSLASLIADTDNIAAAAKNLEERNAFPVFSIDHLVRRACLKSAAEVLSSLNLLVPLTENQNISFARGEVMRPDIVCFNPECECAIVFELKKAVQTGRQALTELLAYEHEIKNLLPLISDYDVHFVLVSSEWSTLMDHSVASAIAWSGRKVLCLVAGIRDGKLFLETRIPKAWTITGSVYFPADALSSVTICLYNKDANSPVSSEECQARDEEGPDPRILTAMEIMAREGDRIGGHGFALLWRDHWEQSLAGYAITLVGVAPFPFYREAREHQAIPDDANEMVRELDKYLVDHDPTGHSASLMKVAKSAVPLLKEVSSPRYEQFATWNIDQTLLRERAEPLMCEFWGELGAHARAYVMHPAVRQHRGNLMVGGKGDWRHPSVGLPLIASFTRPKIFPDGDVRCSDAFRLGVMISLDQLIRLNLRADSENASLKCLFAWNWCELISALDEVVLLGSAAKNVKSPDSALHLSADPLRIDEESMQSFLDWLEQSFFQKSPLHCELFEIGLNGAFVFEMKKGGLFEGTTQKEFVDEISDRIKLVTQAAVQLYQESKASNEFSRHAVSALRLHVDALGLEEDFVWESFEQLKIETLLDAWELTLEAIDSVVPSVFHEHAAVAPVNVDWAWLKQGVQEMRLRGVQDAGVILLPNGQLVTGPALPEECRALMRPDDPENQVLYLDRSNGLGVVTIKTWAQLSDLFAAGGRGGIETESSS